MFFGRWRRENGSFQTEAPIFDKFLKCRAIFDVYLSKTTTFPLCITRHSNWHLFRLL